MAVAPNRADEPELEMAKARAGLYGLVSRVFSDKPTAVLLKGLKDNEMIESLATMDVVFDEDFIAGDEEAQAEELAVAYARLFLAGGPHIAPYESVYIRGWSEDKPQLWGETTVAVAKFYEKVGLELKSGQVPDHLGLELEAMAVLAECEAARHASGDAAGAGLLEKLQSRFCQEHLIQWVPKICEEIEQQTESSFYRSMAALTAGLVQVHCGGEDIIIET